MDDTFRIAEDSLSSPSTIGELPVKNRHHVKYLATISDYILLLQEPVVFGFLHHSHQQISPVVLLESNLVIT